MKKLSIFKILNLDLQRLFNPSGDINGSNKVNVLKAFHPRFAPVILIRLSYFFYQISLFRIFSHLLTWLNIFIFGIESTPRCKIGSGLVIPHSSGIVLGALSIGKNATIFQGVTLGAQVADMYYDPKTRPKIGNNVTIGSGAKILGAVSVGNNVVIGANSVVLHDIPDSRMVAGVPAKIITKKD